MTHAAIPRPRTPLDDTATAAHPVMFLLGTHQPHWLHSNTVPLFVSDRRLRGYRLLPVAAGPWALDSGGFTQLQQYGSWDHGPTPVEYAARVRRYRDEIGRLLWAAPQDWMCEPIVIHGGTVAGIRFAGTRGHLDPDQVLTDAELISEHQRRTVANLLQLREIAPDLPFIPVLQGWTGEDYLRCVQLYRDAGVDLAAENLVGVGSVCRRQATGEAAHIIAAIREAVPGIRLHGFGIKTTGLLRYGHLLASADSLAWSYAARREPALPGCSGHRNCANCRTYAHAWRRRLLTQLAGTQIQPTLWEDQT
jgi:hypothetical protein